MNRRRFFTALGAVAAGIVTTTRTAWADQAEAKLEVPESAAQGSEITLKLTVIHSSNNFLHYTEWARIQANGREIARWDFSSFNLPEGATFSKEVKIRLTETLHITARANCNLHGSLNEANATVKMIS
jgi:desulfoferrodoxin (superoxide reductase-like protein)